MAAKIKATGNLAVSEKETEDNQETASKGSIAAVVKKLVKKGKEKGFLTYDEINKALPAEEFSSEQIEDAMATFSDIGVQLVESEDDVADEEGGEKAAEDKEKEKDEDEYESGGNIAVTSFR